MMAMAAAIARPEAVPVVAHGISIASMEHALATLVGPAGGAI